MDEKELLKTLGVPLEGAVQKKKILIIPGDTFGCGQYRCVLPYKQLIEKHNSDPNSPLQFNILLQQQSIKAQIGFFRQFDVVMVQRVLNNDLLKLVKALKTINKIVIQDIDDDLYNVDPENPFATAMRMKQIHLGTNYKNIFEESFKYCDYIHTTTPELVSLYSKKFKVPASKFRVFKNVVDFTHPGLSQNKRDQLPKDKVIIGWQGGSSHINDLRVIQNINDFIVTTPNIIFAYCGDNQTWQKVFGNLSVDAKKKVLYIPPVTDTFDKFPSIPSLFDIGLAPLQTSKFNKCKSWLKQLEYGAFGTPTIASPIPDYERFEKLSNGGSYIVKSNKSIDWVKAMKRMVEDEKLRKRMGEKAYKTIREKLNTEVLLESREKFYYKILGL